MKPLLGDPYIELYVPDAKTEQEFLRLTVQAAAMTYRAVHHKDSSPPQTNSNDVIALQQCIDRS